MGDEIEKFIDKEIERIANEIFTKSQENLVEPNEKGYIISDTGELLQSGSVRKISDGEWEIRYTANWAIWVEHGTDPYSMPTQPIKEWAMRKLGKSEIEAEKIAWGVRGKVLKEGFEPKFFLTNAKNSVLSREGIR